VYDNFEIALPKSEEARLVSKFNTFVLEEKTLPRLDLIVLTKEESLRDFTPPAHLFELSYENTTFRGWKRKHALGKTHAKTDSDFDRGMSLTAQ